MKDRMAPQLCHEHSFYSSVLKILGGRFINISIAIHCGKTESR